MLSFCFVLFYFASSRTVVSLLSFIPLMKCVLSDYPESSIFLGARDTKANVRPQEASHASDLSSLSFNLLSQVGCPSNIPWSKDSGVSSSFGRYSKRVEKWHSWRKVENTECIINPATTANKLKLLPFGEETVQHALQGYPIWGEETWGFYIPAFLRALIPSTSRLPCKGIFSSFWESPGQKRSRCWQLEYSWRALKWSAPRDLSKAQTATALCPKIMNLSILSFGWFQSLLSHIKLKKEISS